MPSEAKAARENKNTLVSLNPCFNGKCPQSYLTVKGKTVRPKSLNPCFNGKCPQSAENKSNYLSVT